MDSFAGFDPKEVFYYLGIFNCDISCREELGDAIFRGNHLYFRIIIRGMTDPVAINIMLWSDAVEDWKDSKSIARTIAREILKRAF